MAVDTSGCCGGTDRRGRPKHLDGCDGDLASMPPGKRREVEKRRKANEKYAADQGRQQERGQRVIRVRRGNQVPKFGRKKDIENVVFECEPMKAQIPKGYRVVKRDGGYRVIPE